MSRRNRPDARDQSGIEFTLPHDFSAYAQPGWSPRPPPQRSAEQGQDRTSAYGRDRWPRARTPIYQRPSIITAPPPQQSQPIPTVIPVPAPYSGRGRRSPVVIVPRPLSRSRSRHGEEHLRRCHSITYSRSPRRGRSRSPHPLRHDAGDSRPVPVMPSARRPYSPRRRSTNYSRSPRRGRPRSSGSLRHEPVPPPVIIIPQERRSYSRSRSRSGSRSPSRVSRSHRRRRASRSTHSMRSSAYSRPLPPLRYMTTPSVLPPPGRRVEDIGRPTGLKSLLARLPLIRNLFRPEPPALHGLQEDSSDPADDAQRPRWGHIPPPTIPYAPHFDVSDDLPRLEEELHRLGHGEDIARPPGYIGRRWLRSRSPIIDFYDMPVGYVPQPGFSDDGSLRDANHQDWTTWADAMKTYDQGMVKNWKEDIDTLLVFAGLFSAVLTSFIVQFFPQGDSADVTNRILLGLSQQMSSYQISGSYVNSTAPDLLSVLSSSPPSRSEIRLQVLWFASLIVSLTAALFGFLIKMWLREYLRWLQAPSNKGTLLLRQFRYEGLLMWRIPEIIALLPVLLVASVVLFFCGLLVLVWPFGSGLFTPIAALAVFSLLLVFLSVLLPLVSNTCPYKSPVGWALVRLRLLAGHSLGDVFRKSGDLGPKNSTAKDMHTSVGIPEAWEKYDLAAIQTSAVKRLDRKAIVFLYNHALQTDSTRAVLDRLHDLPAAERLGALLEMIGNSLGYSTGEDLVDDMLRNVHEFTRRLKHRVMSSEAAGAQVAALRRLLNSMPSEDADFLPCSELLRFLSLRNASPTPIPVRVAGPKNILHKPHSVSPASLPQSTAPSLHEHKTKEHSPHESDADPQLDLGATATLLSSAALALPSDWFARTPDDRLLHINAAAAALRSIAHEPALLDRPDARSDVETVLNALCALVEACTETRTRDLGLPAPAPDWVSPLVLLARRWPPPALWAVLYAARDADELGLITDGALVVPALFGAEERGMSRLAVFRAYMSMAFPLLRSPSQPTMNFMIPPENGNDVDEHSSSGSVPLPIPEKYDPLKYLRRAGAQSAGEPDERNRSR